MLGSVAAVARTDSNAPKRRCDRAWLDAWTGQQADPASRPDDATKRSLATQPNDDLQRTVGAMEQRRRNCTRRPGYRGAGRNPKNGIVSTK